MPYSQRHIKNHRCCVGPLDYIRKQQVASIEKMDCGICAAAIGKSIQGDSEIENGKFEIMIGSAEQWLSDLWRKALPFGALHQTKVLVVDEVHYCGNMRGLFVSFLLN